MFSLAQELYSSGRDADEKWIETHLYRVIARIPITRYIHIPYDTYDIVPRTDVSDFVVV